MTQHSITPTLPSLISYPARPVNGGRLEDAPPKIGPWVYQPKIKDWRAVVHVPTKRIWNRHGEPMSISADLATPLMILSGFPFEWLDVGVMDRQNQLLRGSIVVFDLIPTLTDNIASAQVRAALNHPDKAFTHEYRRKTLEQHFDILPWAPDLPRMGKKNTTDRVFLVSECGNVPKGVTDWWLAMQEANVDLGGSFDPTDMKNFYEGLVAKRTDKPYPIQLLSPEKTTPWMMKHRFDQ